MKIEEFIANNPLPNSPNLYELQDYLSNFAKAILAELTVEKKDQKEMFTHIAQENFTDAGRILGFNAAIDAYEEKKKTLLGL